MKMTERVHQRWTDEFPAILERGDSAAECQTRNRESLGSNPLCYRSTHDAPVLSAV